MVAELLVFTGASEFPTKAADLYKMVLYVSTKIIMAVNSSVAIHITSRCPRPEKNPSQTVVGRYCSESSRHHYQKMKMKIYCSLLSHSGLYAAVRYLAYLNYRLT